MIRNAKTLMLVVTLGFGSCTAQESSVFPQGYNAQTSKKYTLSQELDEISGIAWDKTTNGFVAEEDEGGFVYFLKPDYSIEKKIQFGDPGDYEDIAIAGSQIYVLKSNGHITEMRYNGSSFTNINRYKYQGEKAEFESLVLTQDGKQLVMICKNAGKNYQKNNTEGYAFNISTKTFGNEPVFRLKWKDIEEKTGQPLKHFRPSAAAIQPATGYWYILSSIEHMLVVLDVANNQVKSVTHLAGKDFLQPEGITFDNQSNMYITNEAAGSSPVLWYFPYQKR